MASLGHPFRPSYLVLVPAPDLSAAVARFVEGYPPGRFPESNLVPVSTEPLDDLDGLPEEDDSTFEIERPTFEFEA